MTPGGRSRWSAGVGRSVALEVVGGAIVFALLGLVGDRPGTLLRERPLAVVAVIVAAVLLLAVRTLVVGPRYARRPRVRSLPDQPAPPPEAPPR